MLMNFYERFKGLAKEKSDYTLATIRPDFLRLFFYHFVIVRKLILRYFRQVAAPFSADVW